MNSTELMRQMTLEILFIVCVIGGTWNAICIYGVYLLWKWWKRRE